MATAFKRKGPQIVGRLGEQERGLVVELLTQTHELVAPAYDEVTGDVFTDLMSSMGEGPGQEELADRDSALRRLLPDASRDDPEISAEFRRLTEHGLRRTKATRLKAAADALRGESGGRGTKVVLDVAQAQDLMVALTDVRLVLGDRVGLQTEEDGERLQARLEASEGLDDPVVVLYAYYDFLTWLQESLAQALMG
ncbi:DUF2017 domain-containing protein [Leekyejoonella antrihumi]|uniref:DUF2017 domain-containing protein n=1 Tax=Leekyejoonella antrihumi TaxID=1660198 RepID=A0A563E0K4_9MICO|nr:DUF2017 domain-containing protein [Leekyejoonella antrihumi]TWP35702.1 DUF2017 domain-containing protein [Leekyejoonella antrihumi]